MTSVASQVPGNSPTIITATATKQQHLLAPPAMEFSYGPYHLQDHSLELDSNILDTPQLRRNINKLQKAAYRYRYVSQGNVSISTS